MPTVRKLSLAVALMIAFEAAPLLAQSSAARKPDVVEGWLDSLSVEQSSSSSAAPTLWALTPNRRLFRALRDELWASPSSAYRRW